MTASGLRLEARKATGCQTIAQLGASIGAVAAINGGYFDTGNSCAPVSLLKHGGQLLGTNTAGSQRGAFALDSQRRPLVSRISTRTDWSSAVEAHGGGPVLVSAGVPLAGTSAWAQEGLYSSSFLGRNPRTTIGSDRAGRIHLTTIDGRRSNAVGMSMDELAAFSANELQQMDVVNMDGGGSTTLWIAGATPNGVVNYPSDSGAAESASHSGSRGVSGGWFVFANPLNHAPRFQTTPDVAAQYGETWRYDADAIDLNVDDAVTFRLDRAPLGALVDAASGEVTWTPDGSAGSFTLVAVDRRGTAATQTFVVTVAGVPGVADAGARDGGSSDGGSSDGGPVSDGSSLNGSDSTGCRIAAGAEVGASRGLVLLLVLYALALLKVQRKR